MSANTNISHEDLLIVIEESEGEDEFYKYYEKSANTVYKTGKPFEQDITMEKCDQIWSIIDHLPPFKDLPCGVYEISWEINGEYSPTDTDIDWDYTLIPYKE